MLSGLGRYDVRPWVWLGPGVVVLLTLLVGGAAFARFGLGITGLAGPRLTFHERTHDLGVLRTSDRVEYQFAFTSTGDHPVQIDDVQALVTWSEACP